MKDFENGPDYFDNSEAIFANILADIEVGKNLDAHLLDLMGTLEVFIPKINGAHKKNIEVPGLENLALLIMELTNNIRFKLNVIEGWPLPLLMPETLTNLTQISKDIKVGRNSTYHKSTLRYDMDNLNRIIEHDQTQPGDIRICRDLKDTFQYLLQKM